MILFQLIAFLAIVGLFLLLIFFYIKRCAKRLEAEIKYHEHVGFRDDLKEIFIRFGHRPLPELKTTIYDRLETSEKSIDTMGERLDSALSLIGDKKEIDDGLQRMSELAKAFRDNSAAVIELKNRFNNVLKERTELENVIVVLAELAAANGFIVKRSTRDGKIELTTPGKKGGKS